MTRVLRSKWEALPEGPGEEVASLRRLFAWLWRVLHSLWDSRQLVQDALADARKMPHALPSVVLSGEPPWPSEALAPREREAEELLTALEVGSPKVGPPKSEEQEAWMMLIKTLSRERDEARAEAEQLRLECHRLRNRKA